MLKWPEFLVKIKKYNHSLSFVLQNAKPQEIKDGQLILIFKYKFHQDRINDASIKIIVENTLSEVFGSALTIGSVIDENLEIKHEEAPAAAAAATATPEAEEQPAKGGLMADLLKTFGGEIIN